MSVYKTYRVVPYTGTRTSPSHSCLLYQLYHEAINDNGLNLILTVLLTGIAILTIGGIINGLANCLTKKYHDKLNMI